MPCFIFPDWQIEPVPDMIRLQGMSSEDYSAEYHRLLRNLASITDDCTGLYGPAHLSFILDAEVSRSERYGYQFSLLAITLEGLRELTAQEPLITAPRGRGLLVAFDLPDQARRDQYHAGLFELGLLSLRCGERSIRFRPALDISTGAVQSALTLLREQCRRMRAPVSRATANPTEEPFLDLPGALPPS